MCRKALTWQQLISLGLKAFLHSCFLYIEFQSCKTEESQSRKWRGLTSQYRLGQMPAWLKDWHSACITVVKMGLANTVRNKLLLSLTLSPTLPVMVMLGAIIFNQLSQKSMQCRKFRKMSQPHCCCDSLSSSCSGCLEMMGICTIIKGHKQQGQQAENSVQRAVLPGVIILSTSGLSETYGSLCAQLLPFCGGYHTGTAHPQTESRGSGGKWALFPPHLTCLQPAALQGP